MIDNVLSDLGYRLIEDAWASDGRKSFVHDDEADRAHVVQVTKSLASTGWHKNPTKLRSLINDAGGEEIEIESGGADVSGHFLHLIKSSAALPSS